MMKKLHTLHRLAWARRQEGPTLQKLLDASPELKAANLTSRTDAVSEHYSKSRWEHVASAKPLTHKVKRSPKRPLFLSLVLHSMPAKQGEVSRGYSSSSSALRLPAPVAYDTHRSHPSSVGLSSCLRRSCASSWHSTATGSAHLPTRPASRSLLGRCLSRIALHRRMAGEWRQEEAGLLPSRNSWQSSTAWTELS